MWKARRETLAVVVLQQGFPTQVSAKERVHRMLNFHVRRVLQFRLLSILQLLDKIESNLGSYFGNKS